jgi:hypothetical protein
VPYCVSAGGSFTELGSSGLGVLLLHKVGLVYHLLLLVSVHEPITMPVETLYCMQYSGCQSDQLSRAHLRFLASTMPQGITCNGCATPQRH